MDGCKLKYLSKIIWIDANKAIHTEASTLVWMFGECVDICSNPNDGTIFVR